MKKRILGFILILCLVLPCAFILSGCGKKNYTISFVENGGSIVEDITQKNGSQLLPPTNPSKLGYEFGGWYLKKDFSGKVFVFGTMPKGNKTLYAKWNIANYTITYELNDGVLTEANPESYTFQTDDFELNNPTKDGYHFVGWTGSNGTTSSILVKILKGTTGEKYYVANWSIAYYNLSYELNGGTVSTTNPTDYTIETDDFTLNVPTKTGYTFEGWTGSNGTTAQKVVIITKGTIGEKSYTANWSVITHNISFVADGTSEEAVSHSSLENIAYGTLISANTNVLTIGDNTITATANINTAQYTFAFVKWQIKYGTGVFRDLSTTETVTDDIAIKAIFSSTTNKYNVYWKDQDGTIIETDNVEHGKQATYNGDTPTKESTAGFVYTFAGWSTDATTLAFTTNTSGVIIAETSYYPIFTKSTRSYTLIFEATSLGEDIFGTVTSNGAQHSSISLCYGYAIVACGDQLAIGNTGVIFRYSAVAKDATTDHRYEFLKWQLDGEDIATVATTADFDAIFASNESMQAYLFTGGTTINVVFDRIRLTPKSNNGPLDIYIDGKDYTAPLTYAGNTFEISVLGNKGTGSNILSVINGTGEATIEGTTLTLTKAGTFRIHVLSNADEDYTAAELYYEVTIKKGNAGLAYAQTTLYKNVGDKFINPLTNPKNLPVTYKKYSPITNYYLDTATGEVEITNITTDFVVAASFAGSTDLWEATSTAVSYTVKVVPNVTLKIKNNVFVLENEYEDLGINDEEETYEGETFTLRATTANGLTNDLYSIAEGGTGTATISGNILTLTKAGTIVIKVEAQPDTGLHGEEYSYYIHEFTITFNKGTIGGWNADIQIGEESILDETDDFTTTQNSTFTAIVCLYDTTTQVQATYSSSNEDVATVNATTGEVTIVGEDGESVEITITINNDLWKQDEEYTLKYTLTIGTPD